MKKFLVPFVFLFALGCSQEEVQKPVEDSAVQGPESAEVAFPGVKGELISLRGAGENEIIVDKKMGSNVWMGDIILTDQQVDVLKGEVDNNGRTGLATVNTLWPSGTVFFTISPSLPDQARVTAAIAHWEANAPFLDFVQRTNQANFIEFVPGGGCSSNLGMIGGHQTITLAAGCTTGNTIHEIGHALGLLHEQTRTDRNNTITVHYNNIEPGLESQFNIYTQEGIDGFQLGTLDLGSIMMYGSFFFTVNGQATITLTNGNTFAVQRTALSAGDIQAITWMYNPSVYVVLDYVTTAYEDSPGYRYIAYDVIARTFSDPGHTVPLNLTENLRINATLYETVNESSSHSYVITSNASAMIGGGGTSFFVGSFVAEDVRLDQGTPQYPYISRAFVGMNGVGYLW